jgi:hypothetical protein
MGAVADDLGRLSAALPGFAAAAALAAAQAYATAERDALHHVAPSGRLRGYGPRGVNPRPGGPLGVDVVTPTAAAAGGARAQVKPTGPWWALEFPRRGGYRIPADARPGRRPRRVLTVGRGFAAYSRGGAVHRASGPWTQGARQGRQPAVVAARQEFDQVLARTLTGGGARV